MNDKIDQRPKSFQFWRWTNSAVSLVVCCALLVLAHPVLAPLQWYWSWGLAPFLSVLAVHDARFWLLPNVLTLPLVLMGFVYQVVVVPSMIIDAVLGAALGYGLVALINAYYRRRRGVDGMGYGDAKLLMAAGAWLTWTGLPFLLFVASLSALVFVGMRALMKGDKPSLNQHVPFGPFLILGFYGAWVFPFDSWL